MMYRTPPAPVVNALWERLRALAKNTRAAAGLVADEHRWMGGEIAADILADKPRRYVKTAAWRISDVESDGIRKSLGRVFPIPLKGRCRCSLRSQQSSLPPATQKCACSWSFPIPRADFIMSLLAPMDLTGGSSEPSTPGHRGRPMGRRRQGQDCRRADPNFFGGRALCRRPQRRTHRHHQRQEIHSAAGARRNSAS